MRAQLRRPGSSAVMASRSVLVGAGCAVGAGEGDDAGPVACGLVLVGLGDFVGGEEAGGGVVERDWGFVFDVAGYQIVASGQRFEG